MCVFALLASIFITNFVKFKTSKKKVKKLANEYLAERFYRIIFSINSKSDAISISCFGSRNRLNSHAVSFCFEWRPISSKIVLFIRFSTN